MYGYEYAYEGHGIRNERIWKGVKVERSRTAEEIYREMVQGRVDEISPTFVEKFPKYDHQEVDVVFLEPSSERLWNVRAVLKLYEDCGLFPDPLAQAALHAKCRWACEGRYWNRIDWVRMENESPIVRAKILQLDQNLVRIVL